jgi:protein O-GlcNAc transferase
MNNTDNIIESKAKFLIESAIQKQQSASWNEAKLLYRQVLQLQPELENKYLTTANNNLGSIFEQQGFLDAAIESYQQALRLKPDYAEAFYNLGNVLQKQGKLGAAIEFYQQALNIKPEIAEAHNNLGTIFQLEGQLDAAIESYQRALEVKPNYAQAYCNLGNVYQQQSLLDAAIRSYQQAFRLKPDYTEAYYNLGNVYQQQGLLEAAIESYQQALQLKPDYAETYHNLGNVLQKQGKLDAAVKSYQKALNIKPELSEAYNNLGTVLHQEGKLDAAIESYQRALEVKPNYAQAYYNLGNVYQQQYKLDAAIESYQQALRLKRDYAEAYYNLGHVYQQKGLLDVAVESYQQALKINPDCAEAHNNLGIVLEEKGKFDAALESYQRALAIKPDYAEVYNNLSSIFKKQHKFDEAVESYKQAISFNPNCPEFHHNLGNTLFDYGRLEAAIESHDQALKLDPNFAPAKLGICVSQLPIIYFSVDEIDLKRNHYQQHLFSLANYYQVATSSERAEAAMSVGLTQPFFLAYQGLNDRPLQQIYGQMIAGLMSSRYPQWSQPIALPKLAANEKIRIGFVSRFFYNHSNWKIPLKGWVENLDRSEFELFGYHTNNERDPGTTSAAKAFDKFTQGSLPLERWAEIIQQDKLHILIFPEFGMDPTTVKLGCLRLAPIQMTSWGHPVTSGLPTIDYYLSSDLMEPENAQEHYTEQLVRLPNLSIHYTPLTIEAQPTSKREIGIAEDEIMFWCCQSLYKYLPQHDDVFPKIAKDLAKHLAKCKFVFVEAPQGKYITEMFGERMKRTFEEFGLNYQDYCIFLPRLDSRQFISTTALADVFLDSINWSGCNSTLEVIAHNIPVVTFPGDTMRGRHTMAILKMMGVEETITATKDEYVQMAVRLGQDAEYRQHISQQVAENKYKLYGDLKPVRALEDFLFKVVNKPRRFGASYVAETLQLAVQHHRANHLVEAEQLYHQVLERQPDHPEALYSLGMLAQQLGQPETALKWLNAATQVQPDSVKAWFSLGNLCLAQRQYAEAVIAYHQALALRPDSLPIYNNLGYALQQQGLLDEAVRYYQKALELKPDFIEADVNLGNALQAQGKLSSEQQLNYAQLNHKLGVQRKKAGDLQTAVAYYRSSIALQPDFVEAHYNLGIALQEQGELQEAITHYQRVIELNPKHTEVHLNLSKIHQQQKPLQECNDLPIIL